MYLSDSDLKVYDVAPGGISLVSGYCAGLCGSIPRDRVDSQTGQPLYCNRGALYG